MLSEMIKIIWIILPVTFITMLLEAVRRSLGPKTGASPVRGANLSGLLVGGILFGALAIFVFHRVESNWPDNPAQFFLWMSVGVGALLTVLAVVMRTIVKATWLDVFIWTLMNALWGFAYGLYLPGMLK